jgi:hypothetical protein
MSVPVDSRVVRSRMFTIEIAGDYYCVMLREDGIQVRPGNSDCGWEIRGDEEQGAGFWRRR